MKPAFMAERIIISNDKILEMTLIAHKSWIFFTTVPWNAMTVSDDKSLFDVDSSIFTTFKNTKNFSVWGGCKYKYNPHESYHP